MGNETLQKVDMETPILTVYKPVIIIAKGKKKHYRLLWSKSQISLIEEPLKQFKPYNGIEKYISINTCQYIIHHNSPSAWQ